MLQAIANRMNSSDTKKNSLTTYLMAGMLVLAFLGAFYPVWKKLILTWHQSEDYSHGFLIVPICLYIVWQKKDVLARTPIAPSWRGFPFVLIALIFYMIGSLAEITTLASFSLVLFIASVVMFLFGVKILKIVSFPLILLLFMIPIPVQIYSMVTMPLQLFVSKTSAWLGALLGVPILREGNILQLPGRTFAVVQACSGLRSIISLLTLSIVFGYFTLKSNVFRSLLFVSGVPSAVLVNVIRVLLMVLAFHYFQFDLTSGTIHTIFGIIIFIMALMFVLMFGKIFSVWEKRIIRN